jgi:hypothetical protein
MDLNPRILSCLIIAFSCSAAECAFARLWLYEHPAKLSAVTSPSEVVGAEVAVQIVFGARQCVQVEVSRLAALTGKAVPAPHGADVLLTASGPVIHVDTAAPVDPPPAPTHRT